MTYRLHLRRAALRLISSPLPSLTFAQRSITSFAKRTPLSARPATQLTWQKRWASGEAEAREHEAADEDAETPISQLQPTPEEEVENAIHEDNAAVEGETTMASATEENAANAQVRESEDYTRDAEPAESSFVDSALDSVKSAASNVVEGAQEFVASATGGAGASSASGNDTRSPKESGRPGYAPNTPKPTVYVGNLFFDVTESDLMKEFSRFGKVDKCIVMRDNRGLSKGYV